MVVNVIKLYSQKTIALRGASEFDIQKELCVQASQSTTQDLKRGVMQVEKLSCPLDTLSETKAIIFYSCKAPMFL